MCAVQDSRCQYSPTQQSTQSGEKKVGGELWRILPCRLPLICVQVGGPMSFAGKPRQSSHFQHTITIDSSVSWVFPRSPPSLARPKHTQPMSRRHQNQVPEPPQLVPFSGLRENLPRTRTLIDTLLHCFPD